MLALDPLGPQGEFVAGRLSFVVGEEGIVVHRRREETFGQAQDDDQIEVEPDAHADGPDQDPLAHPAHPAEVGLELELDGRG